MHLYRAPHRGGRAAQGPSVATSIRVTPGTRSPRTCTTHRTEAAGPPKAPASRPASASHQAPEAHAPVRRTAPRRPGDPGPSVATGIRVTPGTRTPCTCTMHRIEAAGRPRPQRRDRHPRHTRHQNPMHLYGAPHRGGRDAQAPASRPASASPQPPEAHAPVRCTVPRRPGDPRPSRRDRHSRHTSHRTPCTCTAHRTEAAGTPRPQRRDRHPRHTRHQNPMHLYDASRRDPRETHAPASRPASSSPQQPEAHAPVQRATRCPAPVPPPLRRTSAPARRPTPGRQPRSGASSNHRLAQPRHAGHLRRPDPCRTHPNLMLLS